MSQTTALKLTAAGTIVAVEDGTVVFNPSGTTYQLHLKLVVGSSPVVGSQMKATIRLQGRKVWTVLAGGNFITPICGEPRVIQGRVKQAEPGNLIVQAGLPVQVDLPSEPTCFDLRNGPLTIGSLVNVTILPGASAEFA